MCTEAELNRNEFVTKLDDATFIQISLVFDLDMIR